MYLRAVRALAAVIAFVLLSAVTLVAPEGPILASSTCGAEPHDPAGHHLDADDDCHCDEHAGGHECGSGDHASCSHTHVRAIPVSLEIVPRLVPMRARAPRLAIEDDGEREGHRTLLSRPPSA